MLPGYDNWKENAPEPATHAPCERCKQEYDVDDLRTVDGQEMCEDCEEDYTEEWK